MTDRNCLSYWFPKLETAGLPVPRTLIVRSTCNLIELLDGRQPDGAQEFLDELAAAVSEIGQGGPVFLRTGQGSGKHDWRHCCYYDPQNLSLDRHVIALVEWSHVVDFLGLAHDVWCVRELLPTTPITTLSRYGGMPLVREVRAFIEGGKVVCHHPYWPEGAIRQGVRHGTAESQILAYVSGSQFSAAELRPAIDLAARVAEVFEGDGAWSVDLLETTKGFSATDMAEAERSFHWETCPNNGRKWARYERT